MNKDFNYKLQIYPDLDNNEDHSILMLFTSIEELNAAENMASNLLLYLQDDLRVMKDSTNMFIRYYFNEESEDWEEIVD